ncbi:hypothetical protein CTEN210_02816 [Chaetoceros tenuissimus]|uniref:RING-type E3 ubiquitin transferase n=1 Tax=Chaetoceros tenuissimus TaxID=426638 RepID=A0AAD3CHS3_9STRA|nr:hypothetical protein CTEN210_02816 [Chaetoceros tenuissimus]
MNTSNDYEETSISQENDASITVQKLTETEIKQKKDHLFDVCQEKDWDTFQKFLSDETISKADKKLILSRSYTCPRAPILKGAPIPLIQKIIDSLDDLFFGEIGYSMLVEAVLNSSNELVGKYALNYNTPVSYEVIELIVSIGGADLVKSQILAKKRKRSLLQAYLGRNGECPRIINLLLKVCGLDLLDFQDNDGLGTLDFSNKTQREIMIEYLQGLVSNPRVQNHIESLANASVTRKEVFDWIDNCQFGRVREYLLDEDLSRESKMKCITTYSVRYELPFHKFCERHGPIDIAEQFVELIGTQLFELKDGQGKTCLHCLCNDMFQDGIDYDTRDLKDEDFQRHHDLIEFILSKTGWKLLLEIDNDDNDALFNFMMCLRTDLKCVKLLMRLGGKEILDYQGETGTILHYASYRENIDREVIKYLASVGGQKMMDAKNHIGRKAECDWPTELKEYIDLCTKTLPVLFDDLQCPICFDIMSNVHVITKCCHRFCKNCITQSYEQRGSTCPVCRIEFSSPDDIRKDPLLGKITMFAKEKDDRNVALQSELSEALQREHLLKEQNRALAAKLKRKHSEV